MLEAAIEPVLIVAPAMVLESGTWDDELAKWAPGMEATQVSYSSIAQRGTRGRVPRDFNGFPMTPLKPEYRGHYGTVIEDECHYVKGRKTSWANALLDIDTDRLEMGTGTPIPNWAQESFMLLRALRPEDAKPGRPLGSYWRWAKQWFHVGNGRFGQREIGDLRDEEHVSKCWECESMRPVTWEEFRIANWGDQMLRRLREDVLQDLPPLTVQRWRTPMSVDQKRVYKELKKNFVAWLDSGVEVSAWSEPGLLVKLAKLTTGLEVLDPTSKPSGKLKVLAEILSDRPRQTLVVAHFRDSVDACAATARSIGQRVGVVRGGLTSGERTQAIRAFQRGEIDTLCASVNTISEGMTLHQGGADMVIRAERSATPSKNEQVLRRLHRIGQERPVHCIDLVTPNSHDEKILAMLEAKTDQQMKALGDAEMRELV